MGRNRIKDTVEALQTQGPLGTLWRVLAKLRGALDGVPLVGTALLAVVTIGVGDFAWPTASLRAWSGIGFTGLFGTALAFLLFYRGVRSIGPARTAVFINLVPVVAVLLGVLLLGETLEASMIVGGVLVVAGVLLLNRPGPTRTVPSPQGT